MELSFDKGTIQIKGEYETPYGIWDKRRGLYRAEGYQYKNLIEYLEKSDIPYEDKVFEPISNPYFHSDINLREYQNEALTSWLKVKRGTLVMPTGSGKTVIATKIIETLNTSTFIVVPTLDLLSQWKEELEKAFQVDIGEYSGRKKEIKGITISTYDSAYLNAEFLGNKFLLLIFDEVHHLPSEGYIHIGEAFASPYRLGLTATYERPDGRHTELNRILGGKIYEIHPDELSGNYLSAYETKKIKVSFTEREKEEYEKTYDIFKNYLISRRIILKSPRDFQKIIMRSGRDPAAREAILARNKAEKMAFNSHNKLKKVGELLDPDDRTIIFTKYNSMVYKIAQKFLIPYITHKTKKGEREEILQKFRDGTYTTIVSSNVLNEGINVPEANVGIILSGTGSSREYTQRLGRLLRPIEGKTAILYELITDNTMEIKISSRRKN
ncbi:MAG: Helicase [Promethearchaeota archaeon]|nr:MAG: Helicase [Candidatus Lokiarchaeota archaeon]